MNLRKFIDRPVLSTVISVLIVLLGLIGLNFLPIERYPDIAPPTVMVVTAYPGANAPTVQNSVIAPIEEAINGVEDMTYITSTATNTGSVMISVYFEQGVDPDMAAVNVQTRVATATGTLPAEVVRVGVSTIKRQTSILMMLSLYSPEGTHEDTFIAGYMMKNLKPEMLRIQGVGELMVIGSDYSMRIWLKPDVMAQYKLVPADIVAVLGEQNIESATGAFGEQADYTFKYTMKYRGRLEKPEEFGEMVIKALPNGEVLRVRDVADVEMGAQSYSYATETNGGPGVMGMVFQTAGSNATEVIKNVEKYIEEAKKDLPDDMELVTLMSANDFLFASINTVTRTLIEAIILVALVIYIFLQNARATLIPIVSLIVSMVGTFAFLYIAGFSLNLLTLFALVLAISTVVDDAIIVVEAVQAKFDSGYESSYEASVDGIHDVASAILTSTLLFMAVFIPVSFMGGTSGTFYTQFGLTMAVAIGISAINSLTLCPALCAILLRPLKTGDDQGKRTFEDRLRGVFNTSFGAVMRKYKSSLMFFFKRKWIVWISLAASLVLLVYFMGTTKSGLVPEEDQGTVLIDVAAAPGSTLEHTRKIVEQISDRIRDLPQIKHITTAAGYGLIGGEGTSNAAIILQLKHWDERKGDENSVSGVINQVYARTADLNMKEARIMAIAPPMIPGYGVGSGVDVYTQDLTGGDIGKFYQVTQEFIGALSQRPEVFMAYSSFNVRFPQYYVDVDVEKCKKSGVSPAEVLNTLAGYYGGIYASNFNRFSKVYRVTIQAAPEYRLTPESLDNAFVRTGTEMAPLSQFVTLQKDYGPESLTRFNLYNSISVSVSGNEGYSSGDVIAAVQETASKFLPRGYGYEFANISREESQSGGSNTAMIFAISIVFIYLILCALYESYWVPLAVILSVPFGLMGSFFFAKIVGLENNIYLQTGLIMLIGLLAKTAVLITEYAAERRARGMSISQAAMSASVARLRPILMTVFCILFGLSPLVFASGAGALGNQTLGTGVIGGMFVGSIALIFVVPVFFIIFQHLEERFEPAHKRQIRLAKQAEWIAQHGNANQGE